MSDTAVCPERAKGNDWEGTLPHDWVWRRAGPATLIDGGGGDHYKVCRYCGAEQAP